MLLGELFVTDVIILRLFTYLPLSLFALVATSFLILDFLEVQHALGTNDDVLIHIHDGWNEHPPQDSNE